MAETRAPHPTSPESAHPIELLPSYVLDALDDAERQVVEVHLPGCPTCRAEVADLTAAADALAAAATPVTPPPAARQRLMARVAADRLHEQRRRDGAGDIAAANTLTGAPGVSPASSAPRRLGGLGGLGRWAGGFAVAATAVAAFTSAQAFSAQRDLTAARAETARLQTQIDSLADLAAPGARIAALQGAGSAASATGQVVFQPSGRSALIVLDRLPALEPGRIYQLWLLKPGGAAPTPAGTFTVDPSGRTSVVVRAPERLDAYTGVGLTAEPAPGRPAPTGPILASGSLA